MNPLDMFKNLSDIQNMVKESEKEMSNIRATGSAGGNMVKVTLNGKFEIVDIYLDPICVDNRDIPMLQDLIKAAHHAAMEQVSEALRAKLGPMASNMGLYK